MLSQEGTSGKVGYLVVGLFCKLGGFRDDMDGYWLLLKLVVSKVTSEVSPRQ